QFAARMDPENKSLQLDAGRLLKAWADQSPKPDVKEALCHQAWGHLLLSGNEIKKNPDDLKMFTELSKGAAQFYLHQKPKDSSGAGEVLLQSIPIADAAGVKDLLGFAKGVQDKDFKKEIEDPYEFFAKALNQKAVDRYEEAKAIYKQGYEETSDP